MPQDKSDQATVPITTAVDGDISQEESFNLIDLMAQPTTEQSRSAQSLNSPAYVSKSFVEDLAGLQPAVIDIPNPPGLSCWSAFTSLAVNKKVPIERASLLPSHSRSPKRSNRHTGNRFNELIHNRSSTPESIASESKFAQFVFLFSCGFF